MSGREGRGRSRRDYPAKSEEKSQHGRGDNPPSRHLWVGNLSHNLTENALAHHFLKFGDLESLAFQPGRSYAFINYINDEDAFLAVRELQGFVLAGNPLRIEFAKADKPTLPSREAADYSQRRDESRPMARGSRAFQSPEPQYQDKHKKSNKEADPSEVLWIGFPAQLEVDEFILRKAFSPFGEIEKITAFPGRTYAFVRFRNISAACKAKNALHGKLFGNPRVHICFAKSESGTSNREKNSIDSPPSPRYGSYGRQRSPEYFQSDRSFDGVSREPSIRSHFIPNMESGSSGRKANIWADEDVASEQRRYPERRSELVLRGNMYEHHNSPPMNRDSRFHELSPHKFPRQGPSYDDPWDLPEDSSYLQGPKKLKTIASFPPDNELPEYPFSESEKIKHVVSKTYPDFPRPEIHDKNFDSRPISYRPVPDHGMNLAQKYGERSDHWNASSYDNSQVDPVPLPPVDHKRSTPKLHGLAGNEEWKWEGTIAKGGTPVCRARCFRVGKPLDMPLPEYIDCTARTSLDMLAKHYYQAASAWVVFFVPATDPDMAFYNEFRNYLEEKQRAAVAKLDERTTLFLVPPSEFSEKVLKVPGKLSISGVILRLEPQGYGGSPPQETTFSSFQGNSPYQKPISPSGRHLSTRPFTNFEKPIMNAQPIPGSLSSGALPAPFLGSGQNLHESFNTQHDHRLHQQKLSSGTNWPHHDLQNPNPNSLTGPPGYSTLPRSVQETSQNNYTTSEISGNPLSGNGKFPLQDRHPHPLPSPSPATGLQPEQLAQLATTLFRQQGQLTGEGHTQAENTNMNQSGNSSTPSENYSLPNNQVSSEFSSAPFGQVQQFQQQQQQLQTPNMVAAPQSNQQHLNAGQEDADADPQKRLQATLQLAAALLQQIQQGKGT